MEASTKRKRNGASRRSKRAADSTMVEQELREQIAQKAYELYEKRGRTHGCDAEDWLEAERLVVEQSGRRRSIRQRTPEGSNR